MKVLLRKIDHQKDMELKKLAESCKHFTGADLKSLVSDARLEAVREILEKEKVMVKTIVPMSLYWLVQTHREKKLLSADQQ